MHSTLNGEKDEIYVDVYKKWSNYVVNSDNFNDNISLTAIRNTYTNILKETNKYKYDDPEKHYDYLIEQIGAFLCKEARIYDDTAPTLRSSRSGLKVTDAKVYDITRKD